MIWCVGNLRRKRKKQRKKANDENEKEDEKEDDEVEDELHERSRQIASLSTAVKFRWKQSQFRHKLDHPLAVLLRFLCLFDSINVVGTEHVAPFCLDFEFDLENGQND